MTLAGAPDWLPNVRPQSDYDLLGTFNWNTGTSFTVTIANLAGIYQSLLVTGLLVSTPDHIETLVSSTITGVAYGIQTDTFVSTELEPLAWVPFFNIPGDTATVFLQAIANQNGSTINVYGVRAPVPDNVRRDGRPKPIGSFVASASSNALTTLVPAPSGNGRILIQRASLVCGLASTTSVTAVMRATVNNAAVNILATKATSSVMTTDRTEPDEGILCDAGKAITINVTGAGFADNFFAQISYDIVL